MKLVIVGTGYVGLITGACFAEFGYETLCVDKNQSRIGKLKHAKCPFYEPGIDDLIHKHFNETKLLSFTSSLADAVKDADLIFITVGTPTRRLENEADLTFVYEVAKEISENITNYSLIVTKSTVPVGTTKKIKEIISKKIPANKFDVVSNPEFLREGSAINDFLYPDRVIIGTDSKKSERLMKEVYKSLFLQEVPIFFTSIAIFIWFIVFFIWNIIYFKNFEEKDLIKRFGQQYQNYKKNVPILYPRLTPYKMNNTLQ